VDTVVPRLRRISRAQLPCTSAISPAVLYTKCHATGA
jgi:hypothetical protein